MPSTTDLFDCRCYNGTTYTRLTVHDIAAHLAEGRLRMDDFVRVHNATTTPWVRLHYWFTPPDPARPIDLNPDFSATFDRSYPEFQALAGNLGRFGEQAWRAVTAGGPLRLVVLIICSTLLLATSLYFYNDFQENRYQNTYIQPLQQIIDDIDHGNYNRAMWNQKHFTDEHEDWLTARYLDGHMNLCNTLLVAAAVDQNLGEPAAYSNAIRARTLIYEVIDQTRRSRN